jgi:cell division protein FtsQ
MWVRRLVSILGVTCAVFALAGIWHVLDRPVDTIVVSGEPTQAEREWVEQALSSLPLGGILSTDLEAIENQLITRGWTRQVTVRRHWPDRLEVRLHKVVPVARWGAQGYLAANGDPMELPDEYYDLPKLSAHISTPQQTMEVYRLLQLFASRLDLQIVTLSESSQGEWRVGFTDGMQVFLGARDVNARMRRFLRVYSNALRYQGQAVDYADARYTSGIAVRFRPEVLNDGQLAGAITGALSPLSKPNGS